MINNACKGYSFFVSSLIIGVVLNSSIMTKIFNFEHWIYFLGVSVSKFDVFGSFATGIVFTFRDLSQIFLSKEYGRKINFIIQSALIVLVCFGTYIFADPVIVWACVFAFAVSLTVDVLVFTYCRSTIGWRIIFSSIFAAIFDIVVYNAIAEGSDFVFPLELSTIFFFLKTCSSVFVGLIIEKKQIYSKLKRSSIR